MACGSNLSWQPCSYAVRYGYVNEVWARPYSAGCHEATQGTGKRLQWAVSNPCDCSRCGLDGPREQG